MSSETNPGLHQVGHEELQRTWRWFLGLGIALIVLGLIAVFWSTLATVVAVEIFGWLLLIGGVLSLAHACMHRRWGGFFLDLFSGVLYLVVGFMLISNPLAGALALTLLMAMLFFIGGIFRIVVALTVHMHHWGWLLLNGVINMVLGAMIWRMWSQQPASVIWVIGLFVGIDLFFYGWSLVMLATAARSLTQPPK